MGRTKKLEILKRYVVPGGLAVMTVDQRAQSRLGENAPTVAQAIQQDVEITNMRGKLVKAAKDANLKDEQWNLLEGNTTSLVASKAAGNKTREELNQMYKELIKPGLSAQEQVELSAKYIEQSQAHVRQQAIESEEAKILLSKFQSAKSPESLDPTSVEPVDPTVVKESNFLDSFVEMKDVVDNELANLTSEQLGCLSNLLGFVMILGGMVTITTILIGQQIIAYFNLETRYPKLARYIKLRQTFDKYFLIINIIIVCLIAIIYIALNFYMLVTTK